MAVLRVATANLLHGMSPADGETDPTRLAAAAGALDADVLALQEVDRGQRRSGCTDQAEVVAEALGARWWRFVPALTGTPGEAGWQAATVDDGQDVEGAAYGVALVSRLPVERWWVRRFGPAPGRLPLLVHSGGRAGIALVPDEPRVVVAATLAGPAGQISVLATHLSFVPGFNVAQLRAVARWSAGLPRPLFLLGDLNLPGGLPARVTGWADLVRTRTYPADNPRAQLDHLLADGLPAAKVRAAHAWTMPVSDHRALAADVEI
jgi:endonuclease/exonuclease/phosphatase family metal-dependent hydrolase